MNPAEVKTQGDEERHILGVQCALWSENIPDFHQLQHMALPRMAAISEVQWSRPEQKNFDDFRTRLLRYAVLYRTFGYHYAPYIFE